MGGIRFMTKLSKVIDGACVRAEPGGVVKIRCGAMWCDKPQTGAEVLNFAMNSVLEIHEISPSIRIHLALKSHGMCLFRAAINIEDFTDGSASRRWENSASFRGLGFYVEMVLTDDDEFYDGVKYVMPPRPRRVPMRFKPY